jgi:hypothetical protein
VSWLFFPFLRVFIALFNQINISLGSFNPLLRFFLESVQNIDFITYLNSVNRSVGIGIVAFDKTSS